jgi:predicted protein tyrosine phosphatase
MRRAKRALGGRACRRFSIIRDWGAIAGPGRGYGNRWRRVAAGAQLWYGLPMQPSDFSALTICGLDELDDHSARRVTHVLSILDPDWPEPASFKAFDPHFRTTLHFHDAIEPGPGIVLPRIAHVEAILAFGRDLDDLGHLLIHCHAGISRSTAAMTMILAQALPRESEDSIVDRLAKIRPQAWPNSLMIEFADQLLERDGRLIAAVDKIYERRLALRPDLAETMRGLDRAREVDRGLGARESK